MSIFSIRMWPIVPSGIQQFSHNMHGREIPACEKSKFNLFSGRKRPQQFFTMRLSDWFGDGVTARASSFLCMCCCLFAGADPRVSKEYITKSAKDEFFILEKPKKPTLQE